MPNYQNGKIYYLRSHKTDDVYIGSTVLKLSKRKAQHKHKYKKHLEGKHHFVTSFELLKYDDCYIELAENCPCDAKEELLKKEGEHIRRVNCVNKQIAGRAKKDYWLDNKQYFKEKSKEWRENNKEHIKKKKKETAEKNKEHIKKKHREWRENNKEHVKNKQKLHREKNKEDINKKHKLYREKNKEDINKKHNCP